MKLGNAVRNSKDLGTTSPVPFDGALLILLKGGEVDRTETWGGLANPITNPISRNHKSTVLSVHAAASTNRRIKKHTAERTKD